MKLVRICAFAWVVAGVATTASAQLGLYGSPETLQLLPVDQSVSAASSPVAPAMPTAQAMDRENGPLLRTVADVRPLPPYPPRSPSLGQPLPPPAPQSVVDPTVPAPLPPTTPAGQMAELWPPSNNAPAAGCNGSAGCNGTEIPGGCDACDVCAPCCPWYVSLNALVMTRDHGNKLWTTYQWGTEANQLMHTQDINMDWSWGGEIRFGRYLCCNQWAVEATYWTLDPMSGMASCTSPTNVGTPLTVGGTQFGARDAPEFFDNSAEHRLWRTDEFHNVEVNLIRNQLWGCGPAHVDCSIGFRFFRFRERLMFGALEDGGYTWSEDNGSHAAYINEEIANNLWGFQVGFNGEWCIANRLKFFISPKFGIYANHIESNFAYALGDGTVATQPAYPGMTYPVHSSRNVCSFLTQIDLGLDWQITQRLDARIGYRVVAVTGVGLADSQIPQYLVDIPAIADIERNNSLVLHGAFVGVTYRF